MAKKPKKINLLRYEFFYGALACTVSAAFALLAATLLPVEGKGAVAVFAALFLFSVAAGCSGAEEVPQAVRSSAVHSRRQRE